MRLSWSRREFCDITGPISAAIIHNDQLACDGEPIDGLESCLRCSCDIIFFIQARHNHRQARKPPVRGNYAGWDVHSRTDYLTSAALTATPRDCLLVSISISRHAGSAQLLI